MTPDEPRVRKDVARNRERLLDAATEVFGEQGLETSIVDVARVAGVGVGTLYRHFPNKEALVDELVRRLLSDVLEDARDALEVPGGQGLRTFLFALGARQSSRYGYLPRLWNTSVHAELMADIRTAAAELLADAQRHDQVLQDLTPADIYAIMWSLRGLIETTRGLAPDMWRRHLEIILRGLASPGAPLGHKPPPRRVVDQVIGALTAQP